MKFTSVFVTLFLASTAMACANGPYDTDSVCPSNCEGAQRCGDDNHVIRCEAGVWRAVKACNKCKFGACK